MTVRKGNILNYSEMNKHQLRGFGSCLLAFALLIIISGCSAARFETRLTLKVCSYSINSKNPPRIVIDMEDDYFCVNMLRVNIDRVKHAPADIPDDVIVYAMKEFAGFSGGEREFDRMVLGVSKGLKLTGQVILAVDLEKPFVIIFRYLPKEKHLFIQPNTDSYSIDLSDFDFSIKPEATEEEVEQGEGMEAELEQARNLRDKGFINEEEYLKIKARITGK